MTVWTYVATVESESEPGKTYDIKRRADGALGCSCLSYRFTKTTPKTCRHIRAFQSGVTVARSGSGSAVIPTVRVPGDTERFIVTRRAISFSNDLGLAVAPPKPPSKAQELAGRLRTHAKTGRYTRAIYGDLMVAAAILEKLTD